MASIDWAESPQARSDTAITAKLESFPGPTCWCFHWAWAPLTPEHYSPPTTYVLKPHNFLVPDVSKVGFPTSILDPPGARRDLRIHSPGIRPPPKFRAVRAAITLSSLGASSLPWDTQRRNHVVSRHTSGQRAAWDAARQVRPGSRSLRRGVAGSVKPPPCSPRVGSTQPSAARTEPRLRGTWHIGRALTFCSHSHFTPGGSRAASSKEFIGAVSKRRGGTRHVTRHTSHVTRHTSHVTCHTSHVTRHTSHVTRHTSHVTRTASVKPASRRREVPALSTHRSLYRPPDVGAVSITATRG